LQWVADGASLESDEQGMGRTAPTPTGLTAKTSSRHLHASEGRGDQPTRRSFQSARHCSTVRTGRVLVLPLPDGLFQGLAQGLLSGLLDLLFHLRKICGCRYLHLERYLYLHEGNLLL